MGRKAHVRTANRVSYAESECAFRFRQVQRDARTVREVETDDAVVDDVAPFHVVEIERDDLRQRPVYPARTRRRDNDA
jgi:hypothetical protein